MTEGNINVGQPNQFIEFKVIYLNWEGQRIADELDQEAAEYVNAYNQSEDKIERLSKLQNMRSPVEIQKERFDLFSNSEFVEIQTKSILVDDIVEFETCTDDMCIIYTPATNYYNYEPYSKFRNRLKTQQYELT